MTTRVFIDGEAGTTGLQIRARLAGRDDLELLSIDPARRKDAAERRRLLNAADIVLLCLPDAAAIEAVTLVENPATRIIDASTAHRVAEGWTYGFPELAPGHAAAVASSLRVANPGCYPTGAIALLRPLVDAGVLPRDYPVAVNAVSGYSGGGRELVESFEAGGADADTGFFLYGLNLAHKHLPEMQRFSGLYQPPLFAPSVGRFRQGMLVSVPLHTWALPGKPRTADLRALLAARYAGEEFVQVMAAEEAGNVKRLDPEALSGSNDMRLWVFGNDERGQALLVAQLDNLGKGASGAAVQCLNLMLGCAPRAGLGDRLVA
ncbi:MAG: N-acetyl-gamma-glutamyl-phosphate reductase [Enhydrobacter sp.]|nr:N-acetyl-gamma-glutamyl-phosphate reductase [Enhydrobacter sp.]